MPLLTFDVIQGRSEAELRTLLDAAHRAVLTAFKVPPRDRYQIVHENKRYQMVFQDTGLGFERSDNLVMVRVYTSPRSEEQKSLFMAELARELREQCGVQAVKSDSPPAGSSHCVAAKPNPGPPLPRLNDPECTAQIWLDVLQRCDSHDRLTQNPAEGRQRRDCVIHSL